MNQNLFHRWRANFLAGLAVLLPALVTIAIVLWVFGSVSNLTDKLLVFLPAWLTHADEGRGPMYWYWSLAALLLAVILVSGVGFLARYYLGKQMLHWLDTALLRVPLVNKIYSVTKQVNEAFTSNQKSSFKTVVLIEFPRAGVYSLGFLANEQRAEVQSKTRANVVSVFVPTTPNPTSGFLLLVPENEVTKLEMSVADGIKYIISLGSVAPEWSGLKPRPFEPQAALGAPSPPS